MSFYLFYISGAATHDVTPIIASTTIDFVEVKNVQDGTIEDNALGWIDNLRQIYIRNTSLNNVNLSGETRFKVVSHDTVGKVIEVNNDIPSELDAVAFDATKKWQLCKGAAINVDIDSFDVTRRFITYTTLTGGAININDNVEFFNPFMNYEIGATSPIL